MSIMRERRWQFGVHATLCLLVPAFVAAQQPGSATSASALTIVVLEGEGAVNIIQQKTAVRAIVEVRDRNNLPVSGATVTFKVGGQGGAALSGGSPAVTVTTNTAGRAALSGATPTTPGTVQISVSATYQGLAATAVIAQTVVATAAQAAAAGGAAAAGATAGGGGLGTGAIIGIVAGGVAVAGGAAVAGGMSGADETRITVSCAFSVTPTTVNVPAAGGTVVVTVDASPAGCVTPWNITNNTTFVTADKTSGTGSGTVTLTIAAYTVPGPLGRSFAVAVAGTIVNFSQLGATSAAQACVPELRQGVSGEARRYRARRECGNLLVQLRRAGADDGELRGSRAFRYRLHRSGGGNAIAVLHGTRHGGDDPSYSKLRRRIRYELGIPALVSAITIGFQESGRTK